jgi:hypothetical protein
MKYFGLHETKQKQAHWAPAIFRRRRKANQGSRREKGHSVQLMDPPMCGEGIQEGNEGEAVIWLIRGLPGSGKSTYAASLGIPHREADMYHMVNGVYRWDRAKIGEAHAWCQAETEKLVSAGRGVVVSNTFTRLLEMKPYFDIAARHFTEMKVVEMRGDFGNIHGIPENALSAMRNRWEWFPEGEFTPVTPK